jgi:structural maintenance of chromosomes protein 6
MAPSAAAASSSSSSSTKEQQTKTKQRHSMKGDKENATNAPPEEETLVEEAEVNENMEEVTTTARGTKRSSNAQPQQPGILKSIYCENFMCHRKLRVDLNRHVTFIHGQNGSGTSIVPVVLHALTLQEVDSILNSVVYCSVAFIVATHVLFVRFHRPSTGKSAVLAAIQICLGAGARRTHRARNLRDLIRRDGVAQAASGAKIRVSLWNCGPDAYQHSVYGDTITVERVIAVKAGAYSGYRLLDHAGVEQSRSKKDLDDMLDTLNIQVENPVAVLDQEESKKFLTGKAEDKYAFFLKATELERVDRTYASTLDTIAELQDVNSRITEGLQSSYDQVDELKRQWQEHRELGKLETQKLKLGAQFAWAIYQETDALYQKTEQAREQVAERLAKKEEELQLAEEQVKGGGTNGPEGASKRSQVDALLQEAQEQGRMKRSLEGELQQALQPWKQLEHDLRGIRKSQQAATTQLQRCKAALQQARDDVLQRADSQQSDEARRTAQLKQYEEELAAAQTQVDALKQTLAQWLRQYEEVEPHVRDAQAQVETTQRQVRGVQQTLRSLQQQTGGGDTLALLGPRVAKVASLVEQYQREKKFRGPVIGPIARFVQVAGGMSELAAVAEHALGHQTLDRFIVTNDHDNQRMREIRKTAGCGQDCGIFQMHDTGKRYDIPGDLGIDNIERVSSILAVDNDLVFNCLVDNCRMEQKVVARDLNYSQEKLLVQDKTGGDAIRGGVKEVYLPKGDYWTVKGGSLAMFSNERTLKQTIGVDRSAAIADAEAELSSLQKELRAQQQETARLDQEHSRYQREWNAAKRAVQGNASEINTLMEKIETVKEEMKASSNQTIDTSEYEEDVQQAEELLAQHKETEQKYLADQEEMRPRIQAVQDRLDECAARNAQLLEDITKAEQELTQFLETQTQQQDKLEKKRVKLQKYRDDLQILEQQIESITERRDEYLRKARTMHFRCEQRLAASSQNEDMPPEGRGEMQCDPFEEDLAAIEPLPTKHESSWYELRLKKTNEKIQKEKDRRNVSSEDAAVVFERYSRAKADLAARTDQVKETDTRIEELQKDIEKRRKRWRLFRKHLAKTTAMKFDEMLALNKYTGTLEFNDEKETLDLAVQKCTADHQVESKDVKALRYVHRTPCQFYDATSDLVFLFSLVAGNGAIRPCRCWWRSGRHWKPRFAFWTNLMCLWTLKRANSSLNL